MQKPQMPFLFSKAMKKGDAYLHPFPLAHIPFVTGTMILSPARTFVVFSPFTSQIASITCLVFCPSALYSSAMPQSVSPLEMITDS